MAITLPARRTASGVRPGDGLPHQRRRDVPLAAPTVLELRRAVSADRLVVAHQPIVSLDDGALRGSETLVRWLHPRLGLLLPDRFLPLVRLAGVSAALDLLVLRAACRRLAASPLLPPASVNVSRAAMLTPGFVPAVLHTLRDHGLDGSRVQLELSEQLTLADLAATSEELRALRVAEVRVVLDDLGAGNTTLQHVRALRPAWVKVDRSLVAGVDRTPGHLDTIRRVVDLAGSLGAGVTAEGVERPEEVSSLVDAGCERGQGWLFGRPVLQVGDRLAASTADGSTRAAG